jgi:hypothetical protein
MVDESGNGFNVRQSFQYNHTRDSGCDWFTGDAVYNADGTRIPLSTAAQSVLNAANIYPLGVVQTDIPGIPNVVRVYNVSTDTTWDVDPATGGVVS